MANSVPEWLATEPGLIFFVDENIQNSDAKSFSSEPNVHPKFQEYFPASSLTLQM
jgi:hypothetical protein